MSPQSSTASGSSTKRTESPDNDSAFCDNASTSNSGNSNETNDKAVLDRLDGHLQLPVKEESGNNADRSVDQLISFNLYFVDGLPSALP